MKRALLAAEMRAVDAAAPGYGVPTAVLMERAGEALAQAALREARHDGAFLVLCGPGNNGGDGLVAARLLAARGRAVFVELVADAAALRGDAAVSFAALKAAGVHPTPVEPDFAVAPGDVVIDALLGTGLTRAPEGALAEAIRRIARWRSAGACVLAADVPSGLHADTGRPFEPCVQADVTVSFGYLKVGQVLEPGASWCGRLELGDIGLPARTAEVLEGAPVRLVEEGDAQARLPPRRADAHKGTFGHVLIIAGSPGKTGAAALAGLGALRGGAGLVTVAARPDVLPGVLLHAPELMGVELARDGALGLADLPVLLDAAEGKRAVVIGPGLARGETTARLLGDLLAELEAPCVLDADALNAFADHPELLERARGPLLLTPHPGEMARLLGCTPAEVQADRLGTARAVARTSGVTVVLKGARTLVAQPDGAVFVNPTGNPGMATGGTGDVLAGLCGALLAQGLSPIDAALVGCFAHGQAGDLAARRRGQVGLLATDLLDGLGEVWARWRR